MAVTSPAPDRDVQERLDDLIPPSQPSLKRLAVGGVIVAAAIGITVLNLGGWLYPRPTDSGSWSSGGPLGADRGRGLVAAEVLLPNWSNRDIRVTSVDLDAPGARLVGLQMYLDDEPEDGSDDVGSVGTEVPLVEDAISTTGVGSPSEEMVDLPAVIPAGRAGWLVLWFEPVDCVGTPGRWGVAEATVDFGDGAFPPFARTLRLDEDPIVDQDEPPSVLVDGELFTGPTALAAACEALR